MSCSPTSEPFIGLYDSEVRRAGRTILSVSNFELAEQESIALIGPNGAGKSTFVGLITRDIQALHRENPPVLFRGNPRATLEQVKAAVGYVSASMQKQINVHLPAHEIVEGGLFGALGVPKRFHVTEKHREAALAAMQELGVAHLADRDVTTLSSGQVRRVLIARALVHAPSVLIMDEPTTGLDPEGMFYVRRAMREVVQHGRAIVLVTHYLEDIIPEINRVALVKDGRITADGSKQQMLTSERMCSLFDLPQTSTKVVCTDNYYQLLQHY